MVIAVVGATGLVGNTIIQILHEKGFLENNELVLYASANRDGTQVSHFGKTYVVQELRDDTIRKDADFALFSAGSTVSLEWAKKFAKNGTFVIDNSNAFRRETNVPLVIPEINASDITKKTKIVANPNCSTIALALPLFAISKMSKISKVIVSTYQAVSGAGNQGIKDFKNGTTQKLAHPIKDNLIPHIDIFLKNGFTLEEDKMRFETSKILHNTNILVSATCVRVPVTNCHSESVSVFLETNTPISLVKKALEGQKGVTVLDDTPNNLYPMPSLANGKDEILVGRLRKDMSCPNLFHMFISMDNIRKGAALNAVQIMEYVMQNILK